MLTREEADEIRKKYWVVMHGLFNTTASCEYLSKILDEFTEVEKKTPKRRIHVGDIYRDKSGCLREITSIQKDCETIYIQCIFADFKSYDLDGVCHDDDSELDLDTSVCYQLVKVEDE
jgi:hypothetical protein